MANSTSRSPLRPDVRHVRRVSMRTSAMCSQLVALVADRHVPHVQNVRFWVVTDTGGERGGEHVSWLPLRCAICGSKT